MQASPGFLFPILFKYRTAADCSVTQADDIALHDARSLSQCAAILQVFNIAETFRARGIPCDGFHIDVDFADRYKTFTYNPDTFPGIYELFEVLSSKVWLSLELGQASQPLSCLAMCPDLQPTLDACTGIRWCCKLVLDDSCAEHPQQYVRVCPALMASMISGSIHACTCMRMDRLAGAFGRSELQALLRSLCRASYVQATLCRRSSVHRWQSGVVNAVFFFTQGFKCANNIVPKITINAQPPVYKPLVTGQDQDVFVQDDMVGDLPSESKYHKQY